MMPKRIDSTQQYHAGDLVAGEHVLQRVLFSDLWPSKTMVSVVDCLVHHDQMFRLQGQREVV